jgi:hypothetical protein
LWNITIVALLVLVLVPHQQRLQRNCWSGKHNLLLTCT